MISILKKYKNYLWVPAVLLVYLLFKNKIAQIWKNIAYNIKPKNLTFEKQIYRNMADSIEAAGSLSSPYLSNFTAILANINKLVTNDDVSELKQAFGERNGNNLFYIFAKYNLQSFLDACLTDTDIMYLNNILKSKNITIPL